MQLSETVKLYMTKEQKMLIVATMKEYVCTVNHLVSMAVKGTSISKYTTADIDANLPSAIANQCIRDAKSIVAKYNKEVRKAGTEVKEKKVTVPVLKKPCCYINNQNFKLNGNAIKFPVCIDGKSKRISVETAMTDRQKQLFANGKLGTMRIVFKGNKIVAQIVYEVIEEVYSDKGTAMGIDLGIKCPAVSYNADGSVKFYGNGRKNKYMRRRYQHLRRKLQKEKHIDALEKINNKEQRIMKDIDHKISHDIIETAVAHDVKLIKLEQLSNIRSATRTSRKNNHSLHNWSFYRLAQYIEYKAKLAGIRVEYVNPAYTSQRCPVCGHVHHANDRKYTCTCGYHIHRDLLGAMNICNSTEYVGDSNIRHTA
jgi:putative transposase